MAIQLLHTEDFAQQIKLNGMDIYYEHYKNPQATKTLFLIHGFLSSSFSFRFVIPLLIEEYEIVSVDFPPFGKSGKSLTFTYSYKNIAASLIELIEQLQLHNVILVGHSMGGQICLNMLHQNPPLFEKAVLLAGSAYLKQVKRSLIALTYLPFANLFVKRWLIKSGGVLGNLKQVVYDTSMITEDMVEGYLNPFVEDEAIFKALAKFIREREDDLSNDALQTITHPVLLVWGKFDKIVPIGVGKRLNGDLPNSELVILDETGHLVPEERPEETVRLIRNFIED